MTSRTEMPRLSIISSLALFGALVLGGLTGGAQHAVASHLFGDPLNCMQNAYAAGGNRQNLNCTANDVRVTGADVINLIQACDGAPDFDVTGDGQPDDVAIFTANLFVELTAQDRFDIGIYFGRNGVSALNGTGVSGCFVTTLPFIDDLNDIVLANDPDVANNLETGIPADICGDIDTSPNPIETTTSVRLKRE